MPSPAAAAARRRALTGPMIALWAVLTWAAAAQAQTIVWDGGGDRSNWTNAANWNPERVPEPADDVLIPAGPGVVLVRSGAHTVHSLRCDRAFRVTFGRLAVTGSLVQGHESALRTSAGALAWGSGEFDGSCEFLGGTITAGGPTNFRGPVTLQGSTILGAGDLTFAGGLSWMWGRLTGAGRITVPAGATLETLADPGTRLLERRTDIAGVLRLGATAHLTLAAPIDLTISAGGRLDATADHQDARILTEEGVEGAHVVLLGTLDSGGNMQFSCPSRLDCGRGSLVLGGQYPRVGRAEGVFECLPGLRMSIYGIDGAAPSYTDGAALRCPIDGALFTQIAAPLPPGLVEGVLGKLTMHNLSTDQTIELPSGCLPDVLELGGVAGASYRVASDITYTEFACGPRLELNATLTVSRAYRGGSYVVGPGRIVLAPSSVSPLCYAQPEIPIENYGRVECPGAFGIARNAVLINQPGAHVVVHQGGQAFGHPPGPAGLLINHGEVDFSVDALQNTVFGANLRNEPDGVVRCTAPDPAFLFQFPYLAGPVDGAWIVDQPNALYLGDDNQPDTIAFQPGCDVRAAGDLYLHGSSYVLETGCRVSADRLFINHPGPQGPTPVCTLRELPRVHAITVTRSNLVADVPLTLPPTTIAFGASLSSPHRITVGSTLEVSGRLDGPGDLLVPHGASLFLWNSLDPLLRTIENHGDLTLAQIQLRISGVALTNHPDGIVRHSSVYRGTTVIVSADNGGVLRNFGTILCNQDGHMVFSAPVDNLGVIISRSAQPIFQSTPQRVGSALVGGEWRVAGTDGIHWPAGVVIDAIGPGARVVLEPGAALPSPAFARTLHRVEGELRLEGGRSLALQPGAPAIIENAGAISLSRGSTLSIAGSYRQTGLLAAAFDPASGEHGALSAVSASLEGMLQIDAPAVPDCGAAFDAVLAPDLQDHLTAVTGGALPPGRRWAARTEPGRLVAGAFAKADFDADGFLTPDDYIDFLACFIGDGCPRPDAADFNGDGFLDIFDYDDFVEALEAGGC